jgi:hypothetical protein
LDSVQPTYFQATHTWNPDVVIKPGEGFFVIASADFTNTFVGEVAQGSITNPVPIIGNGGYVAVSSPVPLGGSLTNILAGYPATDQDLVNTWNVGTQDLDAVQYTYFQATGKWQPDANIPVGDGFFLIRSGPQVTWVRNFTVQ